ncbi:MAG: AbrB/MazE/SpoVT family DNA-binding domain-containing protein [Clostridiales bacterium]|jgi:transcriptional pleiotropic regulator of transition state genes|nr:AbrB/MazE/SpoVT family DNA-binding domain-containing protein [Clostridiales bacterium]
MKSLGIVRKIDELGRIVLPIELRRTYEVNVGDPLEIYTEGKMIIIKKYAPECVFCGNAGNVEEFKGKNICPSCKNEIKKINIPRK